METILIGVTALSLTISIILGMLLARLLREERRRADARVNLLTELAAAGAPSHEPAIAFSDLELSPSNATSGPAGALFLEPERPSPWPLRVAAAGVSAVVLGLLLLGWNAMDDAGRPQPPAVQSSSSAPPPLELLSLAHSRQNDGLTITGLVQNPRGAGTISNVQATVLVFGADGSLLASARAPLDFTTLPPGNESPFVIRIATTGASRYRVGFRGADGQPLAHVDRRNLDAVVRKELP